jgi:hypothetical protein
MKWLGLALVLGLAVGCAKAGSAIEDVPGATETNVARGMCSRDAECPGSRCIVQSGSPMGMCEDEDDAGAESTCVADEDCAERERCSGRGFCYRLGGS